MEEPQISNVELPNEVNLLGELEDKKFLATPEMVFEWKKYYLREGHTVASMKTYYNYIKSFVDYGIEITQKEVDRFRSKSSSGGSAGALKNFFNFLVRKKEFPEQLLYIHFDKSKSKRKMPESIEAQEVHKIIDGMHTLKDKYFTIVMSNLGLRISECLKLKFEDFSWSSWLLDKTKQGSVNLKNTKGGKFRTIPVPVEMMEMLYSDSVNPNKTTDGIPIGNLIFNYGIEKYIYDKEQSNEENLDDYFKYASDRYRDLLEKVSKEVLQKKVHPHQFRHFKAQDLLNKGLPLIHLKSFLGHSSISSTEIYAKSSAEALKREMEKLNENIS